MACNERFTTLTPGVDYAGKILRYVTTDSTVNAGVTYSYPENRWDQKGRGICVMNLQAEGTFGLKNWQVSPIDF